MTRLAEILADCDISTTKLAETCGLKRCAVALWVAGRAQPGVQNALAVTRGLSTITGETYTVERVWGQDSEDRA